MKNILITLLFITASVLITGCSTSTKVIVPEGTELYIDDQHVKIAEDNTVTTSPFFWSKAGDPPDGGIPFTLKKGKKIILEGHLLSQFRASSILWPPFAFLYWPMGFEDNISYNLTNKSEIVDQENSVSVYYLK